MRDRRQASLAVTVRTAGHDEPGYHRIMRTVAFVLLSSVAACGGQPALANAPRPDPAAVAGVAAAAAAAATLADPDAATRKPEKKDETPKREVEVKEHVPSDVFDRLDEKNAKGSDAPATAPPAKKPAGPLPKLPSPRDAVDPDAKPTPP
jgi:hypothetical protein